MPGAYSLARARTGALPDPEVVMSHRRTVLTTALAATALAGAALLPGVATAGDGSEGAPDLLRSGLVGSTPTADGGPTLFGAVPGGKPWVVGTSTVRVRRDGQIDVRVRDLVIPTAPFDGTNPVPAVSATLYCNGTIADTSATVPLSVPGGDARIRDVLTVPASCAAPAVLLNPGGDTTVWIAANG